MLTPEQVAIPAQTFDLLKNKVIVSATALQPYFRNKLERQPIGSRPAFKTVQVLDFRNVSSGLTGYGLNYIHGLLHQDAFEFIGGEEEQVYLKDEINFTKDGQTYHVPSQVAIISPDGLGIAVITAQREYTFYINSRRVTMTAEEVAAAGKISVDELYEKTAFVLKLEERNPETHLTSVFASVSVSSGSLPETEIYINGEQMVKSYGSYTTSYNKAGVGLVKKLRLHTSSGVTEVPFDAVVTASGDPICILEYYIEETPAQGKNFSVSAYFDLNEKKAIQALPRTPAEGVEFI